MKPQHKTAIFALIIVAALFGVYKTMATQPLDNKWDELFRAKADVITQYSAANVIHLRNTEVISHSLSRSHLINDRFDNVKFDDAIFQDGTLTNVTFNGGIIHDTSFAGSTLTKVSFSDIKMNDVSFVDAALIDVTFKNCKIYNAKIHSLRTSKVTFENCDMANVEFFDSELDITLINTRIHELGDFLGLKPGSRVTLKNSYIGPYSDFSSSHLASFTAVGSELRDFAMGESIGEMTLKNSKLNFTLGSAMIDRLTVELCDIELLSHGDAIIKKATISDCKAASRLSFIDATFGHITLRGCDINSFAFWDSSADSAIFSNLKLREVQGEGLKANELTLHNVTFSGETTLKNALADEIVLHNVTVAPGATLELTGSNIPLKR